MEVFANGVTLEEIVNDIDEISLTYDKLFGNSVPYKEAAKKGFFLLVARPLFFFLVLENSNPPQIFWTDEPYFFAKHCNMLVKKQRLCQQCTLE